MAMPAAAEPQHYLNYIDGDWKPSISGQIFDNTNPAHQSQVIGRFQRSTLADIDAAIAAAESAFPAWRALPAPTRGAIILRAALILERDRDRIATQLTQEMGKPLKEAQGDLQTAIDFAKFVAGEGSRAEGEVVPSALPDKICQTLRQPLGVVGIITPWNFPMAIPAWKTFPALLAGNTVVLKPASDTPLSSLALVEALVEAGVPQGVMNLVTGPGSTLGDALVTDPRVAMISYATGESSAGAAVDKVAEATRLARELAPGVPIDGPMQYDAAAIRSVARSKRPGSEVAGRATVFVFPDLNTGNTTYKAVQRGAGVVSIGPVLQGLARPVNDLSRGAQVEDIIYTIAVTAIQAAARSGRPAGVADIA